jgi:hypothetical protein
MNRFRVLEQCFVQPIGAMVIPDTYRTAKELTALRGMHMHFSSGFTRSGDWYDRLAKKLSERLGILRGRCRSCYAQLV